MKYLLVIFLSFGLFSCGPTEGDKTLNALNFQGGVRIAQESTQPEIADIGKNIAENSQVIAVGIGTPKEPVTSYSSEQSATAREQAKREHESEAGFFTWAKKLVGDNLPWAGAIIGLVSTLVGVTRKMIHNKRKLTAVYSGVNNAINDFKIYTSKEKGKDGESLDVGASLVNIMSTAAGFYNVYTDINSDVKSLTKKGVLKEY